MNFFQKEKLLGKFGNQLIRLSKSSISDEEKKAVLNILDHEYLGMGREVREFEKELEIFFKNNVVCVVNGTAALQLAIESCDIGLGDEIIVPSLTYISSFQAISACLAKPIPCDVDEHSYQISIKDAEAKINSKTKAIMPVHYSGHADNLNAVYALANKYSLRVIEDAAHAFGSKYNKNLIGTKSDIACFSFDGIKNITCGEGGCVVTGDEKVLKRIRNSRILGIKNESEHKYKDKRQWKYDVDRQGWRYHMSNIMASIGRIQLNRFAELSSKRQNLCKEYDKILKENEFISILDRDYNNIVPHIYPIRILGLKNFDGLKNRLMEYGIETGKHYFPNHMLSYFKKMNNVRLPITEKIYPELITLPLHPDLSYNDINYICDSLINSYKDFL